MFKVRNYQNFKLFKQGMAVLHDVHNVPNASQARYDEEVRVHGVRGTAALPRELRAAPGENVTFDGTEAITGWAVWKTLPSGAKIWRTTSPAPLSFSAKAFRERGKGEELVRG